jgi:hypothetical protein
MPATVIPSAPAVDFAALTEAEQYALVYAVRARRIRAEGLPARPDYGPPEPAIARELVHGTSPILRWTTRRMTVPQDQVRLLRSDGARIARP